MWWGQGDLGVWNIMSGGLDCGGLDCALTGFAGTKKIYERLLGADRSILTGFAQ